jgi:predicted N-acyltransferase
MLKAIPSALSIPRADCDRLANPEGAEFNPLAAQDLFRCLEQAGCAAANTASTPRHLVMEDKPGRIAGIAPCSRKRKNIRKERAALEA